MLPDLEVAPAKLTDWLEQPQTVEAKLTQKACSLTECGIVMWSELAEVSSRFHSFPIGRSKYQARFVAIFCGETTVQLK